MSVCRDEIKDPSCQARVTRTQEVAASDIRFDIPLAEACHQDRQLFCSGVAAGSARVIRCLQDRFAPFIKCISTVGLTPICGTCLPSERLTQSRKLCGTPCHVLSLSMCVWVCGCVCSLVGRGKSTAQRTAVWSVRPSSFAMSSANKADWCTRNCRQVLSDVHTRTHWRKASAKAITFGMGTG